MKILIINQPLNNRGDEAAHKALVRRILQEFKKVQIIVIFLDQNNDSIRQFEVIDDRIKYVNIISKRGFYRYSYACLKNGLTIFWKLHPTMRQIFRYYQWADNVVSAPGGICMGGFQVWHHLMFLKIAKILNLPLYYYGRSFGPFPTYTRDNRIFKKISLELLHYFKYLSIRDQETEKLARKLNLNFVSTVDTAFLEKPEVKIPNEIQKELNDIPYIVFVPNSLNWHYAYKDRVSMASILHFYSEIIKMIMDNFPKLNIVLLPQLFNQPINDYDFFLQLKQKNPQAPLIVVSDIYSSDIQQTIIKNAKFVIGARYHSIVFSINQNVPFIALSYEHKISGLLETLNKQDSIIDILHALDSNDSIHKTIEHIYNNLQSMKKDEECQQKAYKMANDSFKLFCNLLIEK